MGLHRGGVEGQFLLQTAEVLQWFSGNIGFHHIHHLSPRIPNYNLEKCHKAEPLFQTVPPVTLFSSFKSFTFRLWDEQRHKLVGYSHLRTIRRQRRQAARLTQITHLAALRANRPSGRSHRITYAESHHTNRRSRAGDERYEPNRYQLASQRSHHRRRRLLLVYGSGLRTAKGRGESGIGLLGRYRPESQLQQVCTGDTGHAEVSQITFDPKVIPLKVILEVSLPRTIPRRWIDRETTLARNTGR